MAHIDAGKTTVSERMLYYTGKTYKIGEVHEGTAVMDFDPEEQARGITISAAATSFEWKSHRINLIDTPGHVDFTAEVERSLRVLDGAVAVFCGVGGVEAQSETVWRQADRYKVPRLVFINKMDRPGADYMRVLNEVRQRLGGNAVAIQRPVVQDGEIVGFIDYVEMKYYHYIEDVGKRFEERPMSDELREEVEMEHEQVVESVAEYDDELMHAYLDHTPVSPEMVRRAVRNGTVAGKLNPVLGGSALKNRCVQPLLDAVTLYLPSPLDVPPYQALDVDDATKVTELRAEPSAQFAGLAFKITSDQHGDLTWIRVYSGTLKAGTRVLNSSKGKKEIVSRLWRMDAGERIREDEVYAGDIIAAVGLKDTVTGDTLTDMKSPLLLEKMHFPKTVISMSVEPTTSAEKDRMGEVLAILAREDPTFQYKTDTETGQTIISGMGELHLEILTKRMLRDFRLNARVGRPRVAYRETIKRQVEVEHRFVRQTGGRGQFAVVKLVVEPYKSEEDEDTTLTFVNAIKQGVIPRQYIPSVERGVREAAQSGIVSGYPLIDIKVSLVDGKDHPVDSSELAFEAAGSLALRDAVEKVGVTMLEPLMKVEVLTPNEFFGDVTGDLMSRRATVTQTDIRGGMRVIHAQAPLSEMFGYATVIRGLTQGRASYTMEPDVYAPVPEHVAAKLQESGL